MVIIHYFLPANPYIHIQMERATGEGAIELPTENKILESTTRALINLQDEYRTTAAHNIARAKERHTVPLKSLPLPPFHSSVVHLFNDYTFVYCLVAF